MRPDRPRVERLLGHAGAVLALLLAATPLLAHERTGQAAGFLSGLRHPVSGLDHVLAMVAVGVWGAQLGAPAVWLLPVVFPMVMSLGGFMGLIGVQLQGVEIAIALSAVLLGVMVARESKPRLALAAALVGFFAIFHGHAHGTELPAGQSGLEYSIGFVVATGLLHLVGIVIGLVHRWSAGRVALRSAGVGITMAGLLFLWRAIS
jgi:urease accessory protein